MTPTDGDIPGRTGHIVVVGTQSTAVRLVEELERAGEEAVVLARPEADPDTVAELESLGAEVVRVHRVGEQVLEQVRVQHARAAVIFGTDDMEQIRIALAIEEVGPQCRLIVELANPKLGPRLPALLGEVTVLSSAELAAPAFLTAALADDEVTTFELADRLVVAGPVSRVGGERLAALADTARFGDLALLPADGPADVVLGTELVGGQSRTVHTSGLRGVVTHVLDSKARWVLVGIVALVGLSVLYFRATGLDWLTALLYALTASTATGGPTDFGDLPVTWRIGAVLIALFGLVLSSGITALITDALIGSRLSSLVGGVRGKPRRHVVVIGLGRVGVSVLGRLVARGVPVVAIEEREDAVGMLRARQLKVPVVIAEGSDTTALETAGVARADAVLAVTDNDAANLEIALTVKEIRSDVRVVTRLYDHDLADRVERRAGLGATRSVSMLAAPAFAAAALDRRQEVILPVGRRVLLFTHLTVPDGSAVIGRSAQELTESGESELLARRCGSASWTWTTLDQPLQPGDGLAVVATRGGLARLLLALRNGRVTAD